ncbi:ABC transporter ATP-binding protein [Holzapfeliella sp. He02]|uniref:ABC transporter ATP-binding protein n=1 Tax=Holzapfeliella saturejae TaxID=3082953 RepID=A0ABU8SIA7_9LACO
MSLKLNQVTGGYARVPVIKDVSFEINPGEVVGLIGLNGAGKSTAIKHILGILNPISGQITLNNQTMAQDSKQFKKQIAIMPETPVLYSELTLKEHLEMTIFSYDLDYNEAFKRAEKLLEIFRLDNKLDWLPVNFSKGMKQKVMIVTAFMTDASLFIIDEPFTGLDPLAVEDLLALIAEKKAEGKMVLLTTHILSTARDAIDRFIVLNDGQVVSNGTLNDIKSQYRLTDGRLEDLYSQLAKRG